MTVRLLLVDDDDLVRTGLKMILESDPDFEIVGEASNGLEAVILTERFNPDVILMDIQMPEMDGIEATRRISTESPDDESPRVLVLTTFEQNEYVFQALRAGASGFLLKRTPADDLIAGIKVIAEGDSLLSPSVTRRLINEFANSSPSPAGTDTSGKVETLTEREMEVLQLVSHGMSNQEIADELVVSEGTVKTHVKRTLSKLEVRDRTQAVIFAYNAGIVQPDGDSG
ncbi:MAG: response regulator transcription factor [Dehalococcoidia bacterium]|nr:response regulator transcription factor [Dehalococcoidia bacterium]